MKLTDAEKKNLGKPKKKDGRGLPPRPNGPTDLARRSGKKVPTVQSQLERGMTPEEVLNAPILTRQECGQRAAAARWGKRNEND